MNRYRICFYDNGLRLTVLKRRNVGVTLHPLTGSKTHIACFSSRLLAGRSVVTVERHAGPWCHRRPFARKREPGYLFTKADRTYDRTAVVRSASLVRYDIFTERVANSNRVVGRRYDQGRIKAFPRPKIFCGAT